jgi:hypothetical protein
MPISASSRKASSCDLSGIRAQPGDYELYGSIAPFGYIVVAELTSFSLSAIDISYGRHTRGHRWCRFRVA